MQWKHLLLAEKITVCITEYSLQVECTHPCLSGFKAYNLGKIVSNDLHEHQLVSSLHQTPSDKIEVRPHTGSAGHLCPCCVQLCAAPISASPCETAGDTILQMP